MKRLLLHCCCAPCAAYVIQELQKSYEVTLFYFNPNIFPKVEYDIRCKELKKYAQRMNLELILAGYNHDNWLSVVQGLEKEPEKGKRCEVCFKYRLEETMKKAQELNFDLVCSTLSISPHKDFNVINQVGKKLSKEFKVKFLESNWKENGGFQRSCQISEQENFYRQTYCGCEFSIRK